MKKILGLGLITASAFALAACAQGNQNANNTSNNAGGDNVLVIGGMGPLTGGAASYGNSVKNGMEIAVNEINAAGGIKVGENTYTLKLNFKDDEATEDKAVTAYNTLMDEGMVALLGGTTSGATLAVVDLSNKDNILQITPSGSASGITENDNVFRLCFTDPLQGNMIAKYVEDKGYDSVAVLYNNSDEYSTGIYEAFKSELEAAGVSDKLVSEESFTGADVDFSTQLTKIKASGAKAIVVPAYYEAASYIVKQAADAGIEADFIGSDGWDGILDQLTDKELANGAVFLSPFLATDESVQPFVNAYKESYKATPDQFAADGYDTVYVFKAAAEDAGTLETDKLIESMTKISVDGLTGKVSFEASGEPSKEAKYVGIENGEYVAK